MELLANFSALFVEHPHVALYRDVL